MMKNSTQFPVLTNHSPRSLDGYDPIGIVDTGNSEKPRSIAVHPIRRLLFWTDAGSQQAVVRAKMDGSGSMVLADRLEGVTSLALDPISNLLFFAHGRKIEFLDINGNNR
jgi:low density lipoprotein receptor-related protein 5/6